MPASFFGSTIKQPLCLCPDKDQLCLILLWETGMLEVKERIIPSTDVVCDVLISELFIGTYLSKEIISF